MFRKLYQLTSPRRFSPRLFSTSPALRYNLQDSEGRLKSPEEKIPYYSLFDIDEPQLDIDPKQLAQAYRKIQFQVHPDQYISDPQQLEVAQYWSTYVNEARRVLTDPTESIMYYLQNSGYAELFNEEPVIFDQDFLSSIMDIRMDLEMSQGKEHDQLIAELKRLMAQEISAIKSILSSSSPDKAGLLKEHVYKIRYFQRAIYPDSH